MEGMACSEERGVEEDLVRFAEGKCQLVVGHDLAVLFGAFGAHLGQLLRKAAGLKCKADVLKSHIDNIRRSCAFGKSGRQQEVVMGCTCTKA